MMVKIRIQDLVGLAVYTSSRELHNDIIAVDRWFPRLVPYTRTRVNALMYKR